ncbi:hypothetical protein [Neisseria iguanae]|uniref:Uncharacterized protein n=1 Tax=Neisseria iguanae TaxID=90242 RepID=A0A2P7TZ16_9NEIS|nr:hypothetical protein [Neisseria iguanae]PSJ79970.1 hypothetical protein C7N83_09120 [Neisseria iguanae]
MRHHAAFPDKKDCHPLGHTRLGSKDRKPFKNSSTCAIRPGSATVKHELDRYGMSSEYDDLYAREQHEARKQNARKTTGRTTVTANAVLV